jgi:alpha-maltose-1-phosphate synthase
MKKIAHILRKYNPLEWGGTETALQRLIQGLKEHDVQSTVFCPKPDRETSFDPIAEEGYAVHRFRSSLPIFGLSTKERDQMIAMGGNLLSFDLPWKLWQEPDLDVIHIHALGRLGATGCRIARLRKIPCVATIHGGALDLPDELRKSFTTSSRGRIEWGKAFGWLLGTRQLLRDVDAIVTCNGSEAALLRRHYPGQRVLTQPHSVPFPEYRKNHRKKARVVFPQIRDRDLLLSVARIDPVKNQKWLVEQLPPILERHPGALLVCAGASTNESYERELKILIREKGLENHVLLTGGLPPGDPSLIGLYQEAKMMVLPSIAEPFGLVILEAWAAGTPVLSNRTSGPLSFVEHRETGLFFDVSDPRSFHQAVDLVLTNPAERNHLVEKAEHVARTQYNTSVITSQMKDLYEELRLQRGAGAKTDSLRLEPVAVPISKH